MIIVYKNPELPRSKTEILLTIENYKISIFKTCHITKSNCVSAQARGYSAIV